MSKLFVDLFDTGLEELKSLDSSVASRIKLKFLNTVNSLKGQGLAGELPMPIKPRMIDKPKKIDYLDTPNIYTPEETAHTKIFYDLEPEYAYELPKGSLDEFKNRFDSHIKKLKSIEFQIPIQLKEIYLDLVAKLENILNYIESVAVSLFAEFVEYINRFIEWLTGPTKRTAEEILIEIEDVNETVELMENYVKK